MILTTRDLEWPVMKRSPVAAFKCSVTVYDGWAEEKIIAEPSQCEAFPTATSTPQHFLNVDTDLMLLHGSILNVPSLTSIS